MAFMRGLDPPKINVHLPFERSKHHVLILRGSCQLASHIPLQLVSPSCLSCSRLRNKQNRKALPQALATFEQAKAKPRVRLTWKWGAVTSSAGLEPARKVLSTAWKLLFAVTLCFAPIPTASARTIDLPSTDVSKEQYERAIKSHSTRSNLPSKGEAEMLLQLDKELFTDDAWEGMKTCVSGPNMHSSSTTSIIFQFLC